MFHIIAFFIRVLSLLYVRDGSLLVCGIHLHGVISLLRREVRAHSTCLIPPLVIEVSAWKLRIYVLGVSISNFLLKFWIVPTKGLKCRTWHLHGELSLEYIAVHGHEKIRCFDEWSYFYSWKSIVCFDSQYKSSTRL